MLPSFQGMLRAVIAGALLASAPAAVAASEKTSAPYSIQRSATFPLSSADGEQYEIMVAWPEGAPPPGGWPALYILDGEDNFAIATLTARRLARAGTRSGIGEGIVIGIAAGPLARRVRDYTPPVPGYRIPAGKPAAGLETGGADAFLDFLTREVMPAVNKRRPVDESRETLMGHSFGGLLAMHARMTRPGTFDAVVAVSPSLWFGDGALLKKAPSAGAMTQADLLIAEGDEPATGVAVQDADFEAVVDTLRAADPKTAISYLHLPGQTHGTTMLPALSPAIRLAFGMEKQ